MQNENHYLKMELQDAQEQLKKEAKTAADMEKTMQQDKETIMVNTLNSFTKKKRERERKEL